MLKSVLDWLAERGSDVDSPPIKPIGLFAREAMVPHDARLWPPRRRGSLSTRTRSGTC